MIPLRGRNYPHQERPSVTLPDLSLPPPKLGDELSDQLAGLPGAKFFIAVVPTTVSVIPKYTKKDLQQILKAILEAHTPTTSEEPYDKPLKACFLDVYCGKSHIKCYNFCQQYEDYFATTEARGANQILFATSFLRDRISFL